MQSFLGESYFTLCTYSLTKAKFYLINPSNPAKTRKTEKTHGRITSEQKINLVQIPPSLGTMHSQMPGVCPGGGGMLKFRIDRRIRTVDVQLLPKGPERVRPSFTWTLHNLVSVLNRFLLCINLNY